MEWLESVTGAVTDWFGAPAAAPVIEPEAKPGSSTYEGPGGGSPAAQASAFENYMEQVDEIDMRQKAPELPSERPELDRDEMEAKVSEMTDTLARPDSTEVTKVVKQLGAMSDAQRKEAIGQMSDDEFDAMMDNLPPEEHERLSTLVDAADDPKRKLRMWAAGEKAELSRDEQNLEHVKDVPGLDHEGDDGKILEHAIDAARDGRTEVDDETSVAMKELENPDLSPAQQKELVDKLIKRKEKERDIEKKFNVNLTNDKGGETADGMPTPRATWSQPELDQMEVVLDRLPDEAIQNNPDLVEIHRAQMDYDKDDDGKWVPSPDTGGETSKGRIKITDGLTEGKSDHAGDSSDIAGIHHITEFQQTLAHEVGHVMDKRFRDDSDAVKDAASKDGELDPSLIPHGGAHSDDNKNGDKDTWEYAQTNKKDYFAEMYSKAVVAPELMYKDLVEGPAKHVEDLRNAGASNEEIAEAERAATAMAAQHAKMRKDVFKIDEKTDNANVSALEAHADELGLDVEAKEKLIADYKAQAAQAMTKEQLQVVYDTYDERAYEY